MQPQARNHLLFVVAVLFMAGAYFVYYKYYATPNDPDKQAAKDDGDPKDPKEPKDPRKAKKGKAEPLRYTAPTPTPAKDLISLGSQEKDSTFQLFVKLDPLGGGVRSVMLNKFRAADANGRPLGDELLELVPDKFNDVVPAFLLYHYEPDDPSSDRPLDVLGRQRWEVVKVDGQDVVESKTEDGRAVQQVSFRQVVLSGQRRKELLALEDAAATRRDVQKEKVLAKEAPDLAFAGFASLGGLTEGLLAAVGAIRLSPEFAKADETYRADVKEIPKTEEQYRREHGIAITRTYRLAEGEYHLGLTVHVERSKLDKDKPFKFRYQLAGARGLPIEGKWYTSTFRNAHVCRIASNGSPERELQELRQITRRGGGETVSKEDGKWIRFASVAVQYFASAIVVDDQQQDQKFLTHVRPTLETIVVKGKVVSVADDRIVISAGDGRWSETVFLPPGELREVAARSVKEADEVAVICRPLPYDNKLQDCPKLAEVIRTGDAAAAVHDLWEDDFIVRVMTESEELEAGGSFTHKYLLYHGPVKPSLLRHMSGTGKVDADLVTRYADTLDLNIMTDYPSRGFPNDIGYYTKFSWLVIYCTNAIHWVLGKMTAVIPSYGLCILLLTVLVRGMMFPLSRRQAMMTVKMQALAPKIKEINEKYKDDQAGKGQAMMELYRKHGVNPLGSCWVMLLQMPVFMGLWYALQESIQFRLAEFWPTWIVNLAAPDMLIYWSRSIPVISSDAAYGGFLYLGPYFNLLPLIAVGFMLVQQKMMTPPPADEQQEMQQKMMKYMMIVMCLMFYKVAAGMCVYFIASSLWGLAERKLLPKAKKPDATPEPAKPDPVAADRAPTAQTSLSVTTTSGVTTTGKKGRNKRKDRIKAKEKEKEQPKSGLSQLRQRVSDWWNDVLESAKKK